MDEAVSTIPQPEGCPPASFKPLQQRFTPWFKFIHGLVASHGYAHPASYWNNTMASTPCPTCATMHNQSVHGFISYCSLEHPLRAAYMRSWGKQAPFVKTWLATAVARDVFLIGKLVIPARLYAALSSSLGRAGARNATQKFQSTAMAEMLAALPKWDPDANVASKKRQRPFPNTQGDWTGELELPKRSKMVAF